MTPTDLRQCRLVRARPSGLPRSRKSLPKPRPSQQELATGLEPHLDAFNHGVQPRKRTGTERPMS
jgi:hypothetical protein